MNDASIAPLIGAQTLLYQLIATSHQIDERLNEALEPHGLSLAKHAVLERLIEAPEPLPLGVLSERLGCVKSNITQLVDRLEAEGLAQRVPDPEDRRSVRARITDSGAARYRAGRQALHEAADVIVRALSDDDRETLTGLLQQIAHPA